MNSRRSRYLRHRFPPDIISHAVWLYHRYCLSFRDVEDLLAERGIIVSYETVRQWCGKFGPDYARRLRRRQGRLGDTWFLDEVFVTINGRRQYLWRAVDQDGDLIDLLVRQRERQMRGFTSPAQAQRFLHVHGVIQNLFRVGRHLLRSVPSSDAASTITHRVGCGDRRLILWPTRLILPRTR